MAKVPDDVDPGQLTIAARRVLLDALTALQDQQQAITIIGAQAVYLRSQDAQLTSAAFTTDGDFGIDPDLVEDQPLLEQALRDQGFELIYDNQPGLWGRAERIDGKDVTIELDMLVPEALAPSKGRRSVALPPHSKLATRWVPGIEVATVDRSLMPIPSLEPDTDPRTIDAHVSGPAALLVAKAYKINDRLNDPDEGRRSDKDAGDVLRLMMTTDPRETAATFATLRTDPRVGEIATRGLELLHVLFGGTATPGVDMAARALEGDLPEQRIRVLSRTYMSALGQ